MKGKQSIIMCMKEVTVIYEYVQKTVGKNRK